MNCDICGSNRATTSHDLWYVNAADLEPGAGGSARLRHRIVTVCSDCLAGETLRLRRRTRSVSVIVGAVVVLIPVIGMAGSLLSAGHPDPDLVASWLIAVALGAVGGTAMGGTVFLGVKLRAARGGTMQRLLVRNAKILGLANTVGFWLKSPAMFFHNGRTWTLVR